MIRVDNNFFSNGRVGNQLFKQFGVRLFSEKYNQTPSNQMSFDDIFTPWSIPTSNITYDFDVTLHDHNAIHFYHNVSSNEVRDNILFHPDCYFQHRYWIRILEANKQQYICWNPEEKEGTFVHVRLGDITHTEVQCPYEYYKTALNLCNDTSERRYISSDTPDHPIVEELVHEFNLELYQNTPLETIKFASSFKNKVLSSGAFSWWIGFLGSHNNVLCPPSQHTTIRCGAVLRDIFPCFNWKQVNY